MDRPHASGLRVVEQQDAAVGGEHHQGQVSFGGDQGVGFIVPLPDQALSGVSGGAEPHVVPVDLQGEDGPLRHGSRTAEEPAVILPHVLRRVSPPGAQVQGIPRRRRNPAPPGGEPVPHPIQQGGGEIDQILLFMGNK